MELLSNTKGKWLSSIVKYLVNYISPTLAGLGTFILIQYWQTHVWFAYFLAQSKFWKREYSTPTFPLINGSGMLTILLNAFAVFVCTTAVILLLVILVRWITKNRIERNVLTLSCGYLSMTLFTILFYSPRWQINFTDVIGSFRYAMVTPFFYVILYYFTHEIAYKWPHYVLVFVAASGVWMAFGAYEHIQTFLFFCTNTVLVFLYMAYSSKKLEWPVLALTAINFLIQAQLFQHYISRISLVD
jgi:hypothetical protein